MALFTKRFGRCPLSRRNVDAARDLMNEGPIVTLSKLGPTQRDTTFFQAGLYLGRVASTEPALIDWHHRTRRHHRTID